MNRTVHAMAAVAIAATAVLGLAACSAASPTPTATSTTHTPSGSDPSGAPGGGQGGFGGNPGVSGIVAAVTGSTAQVQSRTSQTAVTWTTATTFTAQQRTTDAALAVGACVMVQASPTSQGAPSASPSPIAAASVRIMAEPGSGAASACSGAFGDRGGTAGDSGHATPRPRPSFSPGAGRPGSRTRIGMFAFGTIASLGTNSFTVKPVFHAGSTPASGSAATGTVREVTWSPQTVFTELAKSTAAAVKVGVCVTARGTADDTGAVTAKTIAVSPADGGQCDGGFGRFRPDGGTGQDGTAPGGQTAAGALYRG